MHTHVTDAICSQKISLSAVVGYIIHKPIGLMLQLRGSEEGIGQRHRVHSLHGAVNEEIRIDEEKHWHVNLRRACYDLLKHAINDSNGAPSLPAVAVARQSKSTGSC